MLACTIELVADCKSRIVGFFRLSKEMLVLHDDGEIFRLANREKVASIKLPFERIKCAQLTFTA